MTREESAARARRLVREHRAQDVEARFHTTTSPTPSARVWRLDDDGLGFTHVRCGRWFGTYIDPIQTTEHAVAHDKGCEARRG